MATETLQRNSLEDILAQLPAAHQDLARKAIDSAWSFYGSFNGTPRWLNPDLSFTQSPKSPIITDPEE